MKQMHINIQKAKEGWILTYILFVVDQSALPFDPEWFETIEEVDDRIGQLLGEHL